jgi:hypothetical protein
MIRNINSQRHNNEIVMMESDYRRFSRTLKEAYYVFAVNFPGCKWY